jgi:hypothetical protein
MSYYSKTKNLSKKIKFKRSGLIFYYIENNEIYFILAIDSIYGEITDLGGGVEITENFLQTATREAYEESLGFLDYRGKEDDIHQKSLCIYDSDTIIIFFQIQIDKELLLSNYKIKHIELIYNGKHIENSSLIYISSNDFSKIINIEHTLKYNPSYISDNKKIYRSIKYNNTNIPLPIYISNSLSSFYNEIIINYPPMYNKIRKMLKPLFKKIIQNCKINYN